MPLCDAEDRWNGNFCLQLDSNATAATVASLLRIFAVEIGGTMGIFDVSSPYVPDWVTTPAGQAEGARQAQASLRDPGL